MKRKGGQERHPAKGMNEPTGQIEEDCAKSHTVDHIKHSLGRWVTSKWKSGQDVHWDPRSSERNKKREREKDERRKKGEGGRRRNGEEREKLEGSKKLSHYKILLINHSMIRWGKSKVGIQVVANSCYIEPNSWRSINYLVQFSDSRDLDISSSFSKGLIFSGLLYSTLFVTHSRITIPERDLFHQILQSNASFTENS